VTTTLAVWYKVKRGKHSFARSIKTHVDDKTVSAQICRKKAKTLTPRASVKEKKRPAILLATTVTSPPPSYR
ncbi:unnamed protein product, partial [Brassica rapa]